MKWEPVAAMIGVVVLGVWLVWGQGGVRAADLREGAETFEIRLPQARGVVEVALDDTGSRNFRVVYRDGSTGEDLSEADARRVFGDTVVDRMTAEGVNPLFRILNITTWGSLIWIIVGFGGQALFSGRMLLQWFVSERRKESVVPEAFWWMSLCGGICLFSYFVWRQDIVGVLGQSSGLVIYARNIRLIFKRRRRAAKEAARAAAAEPTPMAPESGTTSAIDSPDPVHPARPKSREQGV
jgi:lipid-A-disaccharide synthase-like uncharacterized protein